jgi:hypothetical protein
MIMYRCYARQLKHWIAWLLIGTTVVFTGCSEEKTGTDAQDFAIEKTYERGPLHATVRVDRESISIAEILTLELQATIDTGYTLHMPEVAEGLQNFGIVTWDNVGDRLDPNNAVTKTYRYRLEPFLSGAYELPPFTFQFFDVNDTEKVYTLETEPVPVEVTSLLGEDRANLTIEDIEDVVDMPKPPSYAWLWIMGSLVLISAGVLIWKLLSARRVLEVIRIFKPAHELAYERLRALVNDNLIESGRIKAFYERISNILRHYIEDRFRLRAPERTTEEFLDELQRTDTLAPGDKACLRDFLEHCDLVKFARFQPDTDQIQKTFDLVKAFIERTKSEEHKVDVTDMAAALQPDVQGI